MKRKYKISENKTRKVNLFQINSICSTRFFVEIITNDDLNNEYLLNNKEDFCPGWCSSIEHGPVKQRVATSIPSQGTCLGYRPGGPQ